MFVMIRVCEICGITMACYVDDTIHNCEKYYACNINICCDRIIPYGVCRDCVATDKRLITGNA